MSSSPGYPYQKEATTNGQWLGYNGIEFDPIKLQRLWHDVKLVFADQLDYVLRVFIKQEPHKMSKVDEKRWRLIMAAPLAVQVAWHMLFDHQNDLEIKQTYYIPSQQGLVLPRGGWKYFTRLWSNQGLTAGLDKSAWDWTAPAWALSMDLDFRCRMGRGDRIADWLKIAKILYRGMFDHPTLMLSDGTLYRQLYPGIMKSGCVNTISTNSHCQVFVHLAVCLSMNVDPNPLPVACGDDTLQHPRHTHSLDQYARFGVIIKSVSDTAEFMGHTFSMYGPLPLYWKKHLKKLHYIPDADLAQYLDSMARMYVHDESCFNWWELIARKLAVPLPLSRQSYLRWYDFRD